jgi:hypothetical protein
MNQFSHWLLVLLAFTIAPPSVEAKKPLKEKIEIPLQQFVGVWRVDRYDYRDVPKKPSDLEAQLKEVSNAAALPIGQSLLIEAAAPRIPSGASRYSKATVAIGERMRSSKSGGKRLDISFMPPVTLELCEREAWESACEYGRTYKAVVNVDSDSSSLADPDAWPEIEPIAYSLAQLNEDWSLTVWVAKNGDLLLPVYLAYPNVQARDQALKDHKTEWSASIMGIWLHRISNQ